MVVWELTLYFYASAGGLKIEKKGLSLASLPQWWIGNTLNLRVRLNELRNVQGAGIGPFLGTVIMQNTHNTEGLTMPNPNPNPRQVAIFPVVAPQYSDAT